MSNVEALNQKWNKKGVSVKSDAQHNGMPFVQLETVSSSCLVYLHGAHVTSFKTNGNEHFFMSEKSVYEPFKALRGGIPLIFPQFGAGKIQTHGFARNMQWSIKTTFVDEMRGSVGVEFELVDDDYSRKIWPCSFHAVYCITLHKDRLELSFATKNTDHKAFDFQLALHTYFAISNIQNVRVDGLHGYSYIDKMKNAEIDVEKRQSVTIQEETDRVYLNTNTSQPLLLIDDHNKSRITLQSQANLNDAVVWNPWIEKAKRMEDFGDLEYPKMICIEAGVIDKPAILEPGQSFQTTHVIIPSNNHSPSL
ncbi:hypothetical protein SAMD00019534_080820 [Acytostelium subglobosum LB1]|uniref:hypothetical protein n=1 Tax=Acytostelium subglobosum LB1 TaxID=1410327 RepID=UPI0006450E9F|nr:hypothetical protein SAMD00019534_080820 [Acytostelium subglobosum LB1]GAM24907.1 hypothetical protein SAMD00019534_080820 [Acytostelium subglobosum LB1]|eukprot:XP_012751996.1 hypothetical protein SAMD00019534_080820 [Acytostelium subglobosum LB1]